MPRRNNKNSYTSKRFLQCASFISFLKSAIFVPKSSLENMFLQPPKHPEVPRLSAEKVLDIRLRGGKISMTEVLVNRQRWWMIQKTNQNKEALNIFDPWSPLNFQQIWGANYYWKAFCSQKLECCFKRICTRVPASEKIPRCHSLKFYSMLKI